MNAAEHKILALQEDPKPRLAVEEYIAEVDGDPDEVEHLRQLARALADIIDYVRVVY